MKKLSKEKLEESLDFMIKKGTVNILALGYKGVEAWREKREPLKKKDDGKKD